MGELPLLTLLVFVPAVAALLLAFVPGEGAGAVKVGAVVASVVVLLLSIVLLVGFEAPPAGQLAFVEDVLWIPGLNVHYSLGVDGIAVAMIVLTGLITP